MVQIIHLVAEAAGLLLVYATVWYLVSLLLRRNDIADVAWGLGYCFLCVWLFFSFPAPPASLMMYVLVCVWGFRLSYHIYSRNRGKPEDFRYLQWRKEWGKTFFWRSYLQVYVLQALLLLIISSPLLWTALYNPSWSPFTTAGMAVWGIGFFFQSVGDYQLAEFVKTKKPGEIMQTGLWKYSRHPNYFGEILMWWGLFVMVLPMPYGYAMLISPVTITLLLVYVSGVPMLEKKYADNPAYQEYKKRTSALVPKFW